MSTFQKLSLLFMALILVAVIVLVLVTALKSTPTLPPTVSSADQTNVWLTEFAPTYHQFQTDIPQTLIALTPTSP